MLYVRRWLACAQGRSQQRRYQFYEPVDPRNAEKIGM